MLFSSFVRWLLGYRRVSCEAEHGIRVLNLMFDSGIEYWGLERGENEAYIFSLSEKDYKKLNSLLDKYQLRVYSVKGRGLPFVCRAHKNRPGLLVGMLIFTVIIMLSSLFVWDIEIVSDTEISHNEILANLKTLGCYEGSFVPGIDFEDLCIDYVSKYKDCAWISVNLKGTVAYVEIQDKVIYDDINDTPRNLVASHSGIIEDYSVYSGRSQVSSGSVVKKGDLLVSGILETKRGEVRVCRAEGVVNAVVDTELTVEIPYKYKKQIYTGKKYEKRSVRFFNFLIPFFSDEPDKGSKCTSSKETDSVVLFDEIELPLSIEKEVFYEYTVVELTYTEEEAERVAQRLMSKKIEEQLPNAEMISVTGEGSHSEDKYTLKCKIKCRLDITEPRDIKTS